MTLQEKRTSMLALVESWQKSCITQAEFARQHNVTLSKFRYWVHKSKGQNSNSLTRDFIRLSGNGFSLSGANNEIRLHYPNGVWLSLPGNTPVPVLKTLVDF
ncbi:MAG: IS66 family insertion sequence element accessory protein TnpA [Tangfeifania sp.]